MLFLLLKLYTFEYNDYEGEELKNDTDPIIYVFFNLSDKRYLSDKIRNLF